MKLKQKQSLKFLFVISVICLQIFLLTGCQNKDEDQLLKEKGVQEIKYLDSKLIGMLNQLNGISFENYMVVSEKANSSEGSSSSKSSQSDEEGGGEESEKNSQSSDSTQSSSESDSQKESNNSDQKTYKMAPDNILNQSGEKEIDWQLLKLDIENISSEWNIVLLDLYKLNVDNNKILEFSKTLDSAIVAIKKEDKKESVMQLGNLYSYIPVYLNQFSDQTSFNNVQNVKASLISAYVLVEDEKWNEINSQLENAEGQYTNIINDTNLMKDHSYSINKVYVMLKELRNSLNSKDKEIFYIKYKNLMEELNLFNE